MLADPIDPPHHILPFHTDKATSPLLPIGTQDIPTSLEIADEIRAKVVQPKVAVASLKRKVGDKNPNVQKLALGVSLAVICFLELLHSTATSGRTLPLSRDRAPPTARGRAGIALTSFPLSSPVWLRRVTRFRVYRAVRCYIEHGARPADAVISRQSRLDSHLSQLPRVRRRSAISLGPLGPVEVASPHRSM